MRAKTAAPPIAAPTITPVWWEGFAAEDEDTDAVGVRALKDWRGVRALEDWRGVRAALNEDDGIAFIEDDEAMSDTKEVETRDTALPSFKKSPLFSLQQFLARMPFPQQ